ncbi:hypothetical protein WJX73_000857 [Symbiochloris irregularis]|uniref:Plasmid pRiA4b Orf3-like domain-containing protein n=1 Tax=Symbiochloris irregularis TaxID=706552 RepID=A0AAW1P2D4_9CHLO
MVEAFEQGLPREPNPNPIAGCDHLGLWGVFTEHDDQMSVMQRQMSTQQLYGYFGRKSGYDETPEEQFVGLLIKRKQRLLKQNLPNTEHLFRQDMILDIELENVNPRTWRRFQVSGGITLKTLHDKVLGPLMGWVRNYHSWQMFDHTDAATWGDPESSAIDMMHSTLNGYKCMPGKETKLAEVIQEPGTTMGYMYDLGDHWSHIITLVRVVPAEESAGRCLVLDGAMACPPEDSNGLEGMGNRAYQPFLDKVLAAKQGTSPKAQRKYRELCASVSSGLNYKSRMYDPHDFDVEEAQDAVKAAFRGKASVSQGSKIFNHPLQPEGSAEWFEAPPGAHTQRTQMDPQCTCPHAPYMSEAVSTRRDQKDDTGCAECGKPNDLKVCSGCKEASKADLSSVTTFIERE